MNWKLNLAVPTPIQKLGTWGGQQLYIKRDDLLGFSFGGNKCRIGAALLADMEEKGGDCLVSYGSPRSNLNRVMAAAAKSLGIPCRIISAREPGENLAEEIPAFNGQIIRRMGIQRIDCDKSQVAETVERTLRDLEKQGYHPYYIYGDRFGRGNEQAARQAYVRAYEEIRCWQQENQVRLDYIFLASGTGMTQGGLLAGRRQYHGSEEIVGISVARDWENGIGGVQRFAGDDPGEIQFVTDALKGGYGCYDREIEETIERVMERYGIALDPTYTAKAWTGMESWLKASQETGKNVLFIHTGGLPLYFDYLRTGKMVTV